MVAPASAPRSTPVAGPTCSAAKTPVSSQPESKPVLESKPLESKPAASSDSFERVGGKTTAPVAESNDTAHDKAVRTAITGFVDWLNSNPSYKGLTVAEKLESAAAMVIGERERDPTNTVLRDTDYYFAARKTLAGDTSLPAKFGHDLVGTAGTAVYNGLKATVGQAGTLMRTDKDKPNSPVGGFMWEQRGTLDGYRDDGSIVGPIPSYRRP